MATHRSGGVPMFSRLLALALMAVLARGFNVVPRRTLIPRTAQARAGRVERRLRMSTGDNDQLTASTDMLAKLLSCPCCSGKKYGECCYPFHHDDTLAAGAQPVELLRARYSAYANKEVNFIIKTTHHTHPEFSNDLKTWQRELSDFIQFVSFESFEVQRHQPVNETMEMVTWSARMKVLPRVISKEMVQTKEFTERSKFLFEDGRWWYAGGDEDFEPTNVLVDGPGSPNDRGPRGPDRGAPKKKKVQPNVRPKQRAPVR